MKLNSLRILLLVLALASSAADAPRLRLSASAERLNRSPFFKAQVDVIDRRVNCTVELPIMFQRVDRRGWGTNCTLILTRREVIGEPASFTLFIYNPLYHESNSFMSARLQTFALEQPRELLFSTDGAIWTA